MLKGSWTLFNCFVRTFNIAFVRLSVLPSACLLVFINYVRRVAVGTTASINY